MSRTTRCRVEPVTRIGARSNVCDASRTDGSEAKIPYHQVTADLLDFQKRTGQLLNGHTTANFPPSAMVFDERYNQTRDSSYLPKTNMWVGGFREKTFTLPFTEDYIFQIAAGSQQMYDLVVDVERAAIRPLPSSNELAMSSPADVVAAPLRKLPDTATVPGRTIMQCKRQHLALHFQLVNFQRARCPCCAQM